MTTVFLVGCGKRKRARSSTAIRLYTGGLFRSSVIYACQRLAEGESSDERVFVLSAKHGLLSLLDLVDPYDLTMTALGPGARYEWAYRVAAALHERGLFRTDVEFVVLAGATYVDALRFGLEDLPYSEPALADMRPTVTAPLAGMGIGKRLAWLNARIAEVSS